MIAASALLACAGVTDTGESDEADGDSDSEAVEYEGDGAGECTDGADNDRNGAFDCDDPGCDGAPDCADTGAQPDVTYNGAVVATIEGAEESTPCLGSFTLTVTGADGRASGEASCSGTLSGYEIELSGDLDGTVLETAYSGTWECDTGFSQFTVVVTGTAEPSAFAATFEDEIYGGYVFAGIIEGEP